MELVSERENYVGVKLELNFVFCSVVWSGFG